MGPLISAQHRETVASFVDGDPLALSRRDSGRSPATGTLCTLVEASNGDRVAREEVFCSVQHFIPFSDEEDAIQIANDTPSPARSTETPSKRPSTHHRMIEA